MDHHQQHQCIACLNNLGVSYFQSKDYATSLALFCKALRATHGGIGGTNNNERSPFDLSSLPPQPSPVDPNESPVSFMNVYFRAINLIPMNSAYSLDPLVNTTIVASICLYNLALVYHVRGLEDFDNACQVSICKARSLYSKSRTLLNEAGLTLIQASGHPVIDILQMAIQNNLGQIAFFLSEYELSKTELDALCRFSETVPVPKATRPEDQETVSLVKFHKVLFLSNAATLTKPPSVAPAA